MPGCCADEAFLQPLVRRAWVGARNSERVRWIQLEATIACGDRYPHRAWSAEWTAAASGNSHQLDQPNERWPRRVATRIGLDQPNGRRLERLATRVGLDQLNGEDAGSQRSLWFQWDGIEVHAVLYQMKWDARRWWYWRNQCFWFDWKLERNTQPRWWFNHLNLYIWKWFYLWIWVWIIRIQRKAYYGAYGFFRNTWDFWSWNG